MRKRSPAEKAKREKEWRIHLARKNAPRGTFVLPPDVRLEDIDFEESFAEKGFRRLREIDAKFEKAEREYRKHRIAILEQMLAADLKRISELT